MQRTREIVKWLFGVLFALAGANHFVHTDFYLHIMPPYLPWPTVLVYTSGVAEILLGVALLIRRVERSAAWGMIALMVAVTPVHIHMVLNSALYPEYSSAALWARLLGQGLLIALAYSYARGYVQGYARPHPGRT